MLNNHTIIPWNLSSVLVTFLRGEFMDRRERVIMALKHKETDIVPFQMDFTSDEYHKMAKYWGGNDFFNTIPNHLHGHAYNGFRGEIDGKPGYFIDDFGVEWNRTGADKDIGVITKPVITSIENTNYTFPKVNVGRLKKEIQVTYETKQDKFFFGGIGFSMFERAWSLMSMEETLISMILNPNELTKLLEDICEYNLKVMDIYLQYPIDGFYFGDDWGQQRGLIMGASNWRMFIKPMMEKLYAKAKNAGKFVLQHSCGDNLEIFPDLIDIGLDCYQTFQPEIYDIEKVKKEFGNDLAFWGGISTQQLLPKSHPDEVRSEVKRLLEILGKNGGYIAGPTHAIPPDVPEENVVAMFEVLTNQLSKY